MCCYQHSYYYDCLSIESSPAKTQRCPPNGTAVVHFSVSPCAQKLWVLKFNTLTPSGWWRKLVGDGSSIKFSQ
jgi:hypothetical protein